MAALMTLPETPQRSRAAWNRSRVPRIAEDYYKVVFVAPNATVHVEQGRVAVPTLEQHIEPSVSQRVLFRESE